VLADRFVSLRPLLDAAAADVGGSSAMLERLEGLVASRRLAWAPSPVGLDRSADRGRGIVPGPRVATVARRLASAHLVQRAD
jgi:hypothetical protein